MKIDVTIDVREVERGLSDLGKKVVSEAKYLALGEGVKKVETLCVKYAAKHLKRKQKMIRQKSIVKMIRPKRGSAWGVVYLNRYPEQMSVERFYTEADANSPLAQPSYKQAVTGRAFTFLNRKGNMNLWAKRDASRKRIDNVWNSSKMQPLKFLRPVPDAERAARVFGKWGERYFYKRFSHHVNRKLKKAGLA